MAKRIAQYNRVISIIRSFYDNGHASLGYIGLHKIKIKFEKKETHITVWLSYPGMFIGRKGVTINKFKAYLEQYLGNPVKIHIKEFDPLWYIRQF